MVTDWLLRVGNGENLVSSSQHKIWGINSKNSHSKFFLKNVKTNDRLWFVQSNTKGKILGVATYEYNNKRDLGPLVNITMTNEELGWIGEGTKWTSDTEIHYSNLFGLVDCNILTGIKGPTSIRKYDEKCLVNLDFEYRNILKYSKVTFDLKKKTHLIKFYF